MPGPAGRRRHVAVARIGDNVRLGLNEDTRIPVAGVKTIEILKTGDAEGNNNIDLSLVTQATYPALTSTHVKAAGGEDAVTGTQLNDRIEGSTGDDFVAGANGNDTLVWNPGEGSDLMQGDAGVDTIENNGAGVNEVYTFETSQLGFLLKRPIPAGQLEFTLDIRDAEALVNNMQGGNDKFSTLDPAVPVNGIAVTINGGDGDDEVIGTDGADVLNGGNGNDRLVGFKGPDTMNGQDGDDTMVWNNGDASDTMVGGDGIDTVENNGFAADERYTIDAANGGFLFSRLTQVMFTLTISGTEKLVNNTAGGDDSFKTVDPARPVTGLAVTVNGGDGDDTLTGTDGADTLNGGTGDDVLTGFKGVDVGNGDEGDDMMVWNNGDASDRNEGGPGDDTAVLNGGAADEHIVITGNGARVTATRDTQVPFFLDIGTSELLDVNTLAGNDSIDVNDNVGKVLATDLAGGDGNDTFRTRNDSVQRIDGGTGADFAQVDARDILTNVEVTDKPGVTPPGGPPADTVAPKVAVASRTLRVNGGRASLTISCPAGETSCSGKARIVRGKKVVGSISVTLAGRQARTFKIALNRKTRIALAKADDDRLPVTVKVSVKDAAGNRGSASRRLNLKG